MKLLLTGAFQYTEEQLDNLRKLGHQLYYVQDERIPLNEQSIEFEISDIEGAVCNGLFLSNNIEEFKSLKYIQLTSAGYDRVPIDYISEKGIVIRNARGVYSIPMAEFAVGGVLQLYKQTSFFQESQKKHRWEKHRGLLEVFGKTVCILGCGSVGTECAKRFSCFGCEVLGIDMFPENKEWFQEVLPIEELDCVLSKSDIVVLTLPLTEKTKYLFNKERFEKMKERSVLINIARGAIVETSALLEAVRGKLLGAVLDVFEEEPLEIDSPMWDMENVIVTPHNSFVGENNRTRLFEVIKNNILEFEREEKWK